MKSKIEDAPWEVQKVWLHRLSKYVGSEVYKEIQETTAKYPEWFPWETLYNSIDKTVHNDYIKAETELYFSFYPRAKSDDIREGEGLWGYVKRQPVYKPTEENLKSAVNYLFVEAPKIKRDYEIARKKLWNKHYSKYKLKFRE